MKCEDAQNLLADYSVNGLDDETQHFLVAHLSECPTCCYELELLYRVGSFVESAPQKSPPPGLWDGIEARICQENEGAGKRVDE